MDYKAVVSGKTNDNISEDSVGFIGPMLSCNVCSAVYKTEPWLSRHRYIVHGIMDPKEHLQSSQAQAKKSIDYGKRNDNISNDNPMFSCDLCSFIFKYKSKLMWHRYKIHGVKMTMGSDLKLKSAPKNAVELFMFSCDFCSDLFKTESGLIGHRYDVHGIMAKKSIDLGRHRSKFHGLKKTIGSTEQIQRRHSCDNCGKKFVYIKGLYKHKKQCYPCNNCRRTFKQEDLLQSHYTRCKKIPDIQKNNLDSQKLPLDLENSSPNLNTVPTTFDSATIKCENDPIPDSNCVFIKNENFNETEQDEVFTSENFTDDPLSIDTDFTEKLDGIKVEKIDIEENPIDDYVLKSKKSLSVSAEAFEIIERSLVKSEKKLCS